MKFDDILEGSLEEIKVINLMNREEAEIIKPIEDDVEHTRIGYRGPENSKIVLVVVFKDGHKEEYEILKDIEDKEWVKEFYIDK